jgi:AraC-like DNA-binding protein
VRTKQVSFCNTMPGVKSIDSWSAILKSCNWPVYFILPEKSNYSSDLQQSTLGPLSLSIYSTEPVTVNRQAIKYSSKCEQYFSFIYINKGQISLRHYLRFSKLSAGDIFLVDSSIESEIAFLKPSETFSVRIPARFFRKFLPEPSLSCNIPSPHSGIYNSTLKELFLCLWRISEDDCLINHQKIIDIFLSVVSTAYGQNGKPNDVDKSESLLNRILDYIDENLSNNRLDAEAIADRFKISKRYLRKLFQVHGIACMSDYIRRKRLEKCAEALLDSKLSHQNITKIAYKWGFNNSSSFTRSFKSVFGITPLQHRKSRLQA